MVRGLLGWVDCCCSLEVFSGCNVRVGEGVGYETSLG